MNLLIFGATGPTGREILKQAVAGHAVTAFARNPAALEFKAPNLNTVRGDITDAASVAAAMRGQHAVLSALGVRKWKKNSILSDGTRNIIQAMRDQGVRRFICETSLDVGDSRGQLGWLFTWIIRPILLPNAFVDKEIQERYIHDSGLDWIIARPAYLTNGPRLGRYQVWTGPKPKGVSWKISRADVADFMLKQLSDDTYLHKAAALAY